MPIEKGYIVYLWIEGTIYKQYIVNARSEEEARQIAWDNIGIDITVEEEN